LKRVLPEMAAYSTKYARKISTLPIFGASLGESGPSWWNFRF
jgi:hypothetical protein